MPTRFPAILLDAAPSPSARVLALSGVGAVRHVFHEHDLAGVEEAADGTRLWPRRAAPSSSWLLDGTA